jgi:hypothetical protein
MKIGTNKIITVVGIAALITLLVLYAPINLERSISEVLEAPSESPNSASSLNSELSDNQLQSGNESIIFNGVPPYLIALPILDNNLYVMHDSDKFRLGGSNLHLIRYAASIRSNGIPTIQDREDYIEFATSEQPYIEFSYKESFYSIRVIERSYSTGLEIREIRGPTVKFNRKFGG